MKTTALAVLGLLALCALPSATRGAAPGGPEPWMLGPFVRHGAPILGPRKETVVHCPVRNADVHWEEKDVFNPASVVREGKVHLLYRAEDAVGRFAGTSRIGLATSADGVTFERRGEPVLFPDDDFMMPYEWEGGCEDPRVVEREDGTCVLTYTAFDGATARLAVASSRDQRDVPPGSRLLRGAVAAVLRYGRLEDRRSREPAVAVESRLHRWKENS